MPEANPSLVFEQVRLLCDRFTRDCRNDERPSIGAYLEHLPEAVRPTLLRNLLFKQPIGATTSAGATLSIRLVNEGGVSRIVADSHRADEPDDAPWHENMRCEVHATTPLDEHLDVARLEADCSDRVDLVRILLFWLLSAMVVSTVARCSIS